MKSILRFICMAMALAWQPAHADLNVFATVPEWAALAQELGGSGVRVYSATTAQQDPHRVEARPSLIAKARCVVIVPSLKKVALGIGGQYGKGYMSCRSEGGWTAPGALKVEGGSFGLQIGASATDVILLVMNERGVDRLLSNQFKVGADAAVAAGPLGREASAQTDITMRAEMLAWSRSRGVYAGIALQGSTIRQDTDENKDLYGREIDNKELVTGKVAVPPAAQGFLNALSKY